MKEQQCQDIQLGDWVQGISKTAFSYRGFVEAISDDQSSALIRVIECDRAQRIGKVIESSLTRLSLLADECISDERDLLPLIELSLVTRDRLWFMELTTALCTYRAKTTLLHHVLSVAHYSNSRQFPNGSL